MKKSLIFAALAALVLFSCSKDKDGKKNKDDDGFVAQKDWTVKIAEVGTDEIGDYIALNVTAPGSTFLGVDALNDNELAELYGTDDVEAIAAKFKENLDKNLKDNPIEKCLWKASETVYINYYYSGAAHVYVIDFDAQGNLTGKYAVVDVVIPELENDGGDDDDAVPGALTGAVTLQSGWSAALSGEVQSDDEDDYIYLDVKASGAKYIWCDNYTQDEIADWYDGDLEPLLLEYSSSAKTALEQGWTMADVFFQPDEDGIYMYVYEPGETDIYIMEFDDKGNATGRYGKSRVTIPNFTPTSSSTKPLKLRVRMGKAGDIHHAPMRKNVSLR